MVSRICEEFGCLPSAAIAEMRRHPDLVMDVISMRAYAKTREAIESAKSADDVPKGTMADLVNDISVELFKDRQQRSDGR